MNLGNLYILVVILFVNQSCAQTLKIADFRKIVNYSNPVEHKQLSSKGFKLLNDSISTHHKKFTFNNPETKEIVELTLMTDKEGGEFSTIIYFLPTEFTYKNFISTLPIYKFKHSKRNTRYQLPTSSYSGENIYLNGLIQFDGKKYYALKYDHYIDKALSVPTIESITKPN
ncbi:MULTISPECIES: hypothetical protein [unclassified Flavobacterium]|uniref:hypothetical protein n=1 Tax=unclassified Flavobacterium TaxID=196869 RepID=UPI0012AA889A|nr:MULTISPECIES: hypothetical protein [unclassified Flavobacterium]MBF4488090.1 hypothetical protein [Flavobacterium sp. CSZ]QGK74698.1 hypothetical protein GIY83_11720 [Flavobacterium sp. SLB02]